jgi:hypothetical protein
MGGLLEPGVMHAVDLSGPPVALGMRAWADDRGKMPSVVFTTAHRIETIATAGGPGPDPHLHGLAAVWARFDNFPAWEEAAPGWSAVLDVAADEFTVTGPSDDVLFYSGGLNSSAKWQRTARQARLFIALAGDITTPADIAAVRERGQMYAILCPVTLTTL